MKKHSCFYWLGGFLLTAALVAADQLTKAQAVLKLKGTMGREFVPGLLRLSYVENHGMAFGLLQDARLLFILMTVIIGGVLIYAYAWLPEQKKLRPLSLGIIFILAGALGNFIDRLRQGYVVDFLELDFMRFPVFNLADIFVTWTAVILAVLMLFYYKDSDFPGKAHDRTDSDN